MPEINYATPEELRRQIEKQGLTGSASDPALEILLNAASRFIDNYYNRPYGFIASGTSATRIYIGSGATHLWIDETISIVTLEYDPLPNGSDLTAIDPATYIGFRGSIDNPNFNRLPYHAIMLFEGYFDNNKYYFVDGNWGYSEVVPSSIKQIVIAISARYYKQGQGAWSDTLGSVEVGRIMFRRENSDLKWLLEKSRFYLPSVV